MEELNGSVLFFCIPKNKMGFSYFYAYVHIWLIRVPHTQQSRAEPIALMLVVGVVCPCGTRTSVHGVRECLTQATVDLRGPVVKGFCGVSLPFILAATRQANVAATPSWQ